MNYSLDLKEFWEVNNLCFKPFSMNRSRVPISFMLDDHFIQHTVEMESTVRYYEDPEYTIQMHKKCNDILESELGIRYYPEDNIPYIKGSFEVIMGAKRILSEGNTPWIESKVEDIEDVKKLISKAEKMDMKKSIPDEWKEQRAKLKQKCGKKLKFEHSWNGPTTMACNLLGTTNTAIFIMDEPDVMKKFFEVMADRYIEYREVLSLEDKGYVDREGIGVNDDNCYLFPPKKYEDLCAPFLSKFFQKFAPEPYHKRRQHSDSAMGHLMGILNDIGVNEVNFGPTIHPLEIRKAMPNAVIYGQMPPFTLRNGSPKQIIDIVRRDIKCLAQDGGLVESPAGVVPVETSLDNIKVYMWAVQKYGRYDT